MDESYGEEITDNRHDGMEDAEVCGDDERFAGEIAFGGEAGTYGYSEGIGG